MKFALRLLLIIFMIPALTACVTDTDVPSDSLGAGDMLPQFSVTMADGSVVSTQSLSGGKSVICFFNTSCDDCRRELPELQRAFTLCSSLPGRQRFICIARDELSESIATFWTEKSLTLPYSPQQGREVYNLFAKSGIPRIYISDSSLRIIAAYGDSDIPSAEEIFDALK